MQNNHIVYLHTNLINNKVYVGQTNNIARRWRNNGIEYMSSQSHSIFGKAIQKYGWENFSHEILAEKLTQSEANELEKYYIEQLNACEPEYGYNIRAGGQSGGALSDETKQKIREKAQERGSWRGENNPRHIDPLYGERNGMYGKCHSEETKQKISEALKGKNISEEQRQKAKEFMTKHHPRAKKVRCIETGEIFNSARQAAMAKGLGNSTISRFCNGERTPKEGSLHWEWYKEEEKEESHGINQ